jgi:hypothetical protein
MELVRGVRGHQNGPGMGAALHRALGAQLGGGTAGEVDSSSRLNRTASGAVGESVDKPTVEIRCTWAEFGKLMCRDGFWDDHVAQVAQVLGTLRAQRVLAAFEAGETVMLVPSVGGGLNG